MFNNNNKMIFTPLPHSDKGFTLAEVLIALVVIGIIAAITMTTVMPNIQERINSQRQANIVYKITQATNLMKSNGAMVDGFASTDAFVDELQKYLKIMKRCDSDHIADCWPTKKVRTSDGKEFEIKDAKTRGKLGFTKDKDVKNVGIVLSDGASLIMTYNPSNAGIGIGDALTAQNIPLPIGGKNEEFLEYTTNTTGGLAFVMDVNGGKGPNSETIGTKMYDIRNLNGAHFASCGGTKVNGKCYTIITSPSSINCTDTKYNEVCSKQNANGHSYSEHTADKWAGALYDCASIGGYIPSRDELYNICKSDTEKEKLGLQGFTGYLWSSDLSYGSPGADATWAKFAQEVRFSDCDRWYASRTWGDPQALCISE